jgi:hypothetical protein
MKKNNTKIGDIFSTKLKSGSIKYLQFIVSDLTQLNSDVIRVFKESYQENSNTDLGKIVLGEVDFYAHCVTKLGLKMGYWKYVGNNRNIGTFDKILFRDTNDYGSRPGEQIFLSTNWYIWRINDDNFTTVGNLIGENRNAEIGIVISPDSIVHRIETGEYDFVYPGFE